MLLNSTRAYDVVFVEYGAFTQTIVRIEELIDLDGASGNLCEYIYAMMEIVDGIMDLKTSESMYFQPNRDNKESKGIITRIS